MPRPPVKRRKSNQRSPHRVKYTRVPPNAGLTNEPREKLQQRLKNKTVGQRPQDSDDSDRLVTRARPGRRQHPDSQIYASGGVAKGDTPGAFPTKEERTRRLRSDTNEIIRRSRSKSAEGANSGLSKSSATNTERASNEKPTLPTAKPVRPAKSPQPMPVRSQATPGADTSIVGTLKPRRRQASILHLIDNDDSSLINPEDEEQFLPDDISTPAANVPPKQSNISAQATGVSVGSVSRKRKLGQEDLNNRSETVSTAPSTSPLSEAISLPSNPTRSRSISAQDDDDIMAPPRSSSPESPPSKPSPPAVTKPGKSVSIPTTEQLQSMMPSKRRKGSRQRKQLAEFDIPEDTSSDQPDEAEDESIFQPRKRATKSRNRKATTSPKTTRTTAKVLGKTKVNHKQTPKSKSTSSASFSALAVSPRTPLPLTRNKNQENTPLARSSRRNGGGNKVNLNEQQVPANSQPNDKQSGGSLPTSRRAGLRGKAVNVTTGAESDKENQIRNQLRSRSARRRDTVSKTVELDENVQLSIENIDDGLNSDVDMEEEVEPEVARGASYTHSETPAVVKTPMSTEAKAWRQQWANIDDWSLDYEEVSVSTGGSSPLRR